MPPDRDGDPDPSRPSGALDVQLVWAAPDPGHVHHPLLSAEERTRCARFLRVADRARHATGRVVLKQAAAARLGVSSTRIQVRVESSGRPRIAVDGTSRPPYCSISHAGDVVLVGLAGRPCGVDVEEIAELGPVVDSELVFSPAELAELRGLDAASRIGLAARWWTLKEAALKASGQGLAIAPHTVDVRTPPIRLPLVSGPLQVSVTEVPAPAGYRAGVAIASG